MLKLGKFCLIFLAATLALATDATGPTNPNLKSALSVKGRKANIIIKMTAGTKEVLNSLNQIQFSDRSTKLNAVTSALKAHAAESQKQILDFLKSLENGPTFQSLWISNKVYVSDADAAMVEKLALIEGIAEIYEEHIAQLEDSRDEETDDLVASTSHHKEVEPLAEPGIELIQAHFVWSELGINGTGAVVAGIASGVRSTHEALRDNILVNYGWFDPAGDALFPEDLNGQGTHTLGIAVGSHGIGVAPGAKWMSCRACYEYDCLESYLDRCAQFVLCPTFPDGTSSDCTKAPHVVSNSWTGGQGDIWFNPAIEAMKTAGIHPVFSNGQNGPNCGTARSPADSTNGVIGVGASTRSDGLAYSSSQGPSVTGLIKPDITAPGDYIRSAYRTSDTYYSSMSGTAMASSHVSGVIALMASVNPNLPYVDVEKFLYNYTDRAIVRTEKNCDDVPETVFPNNAFGWGRLNAFRSVRSLINSMKK